MSRNLNAVPYGILAAMLPFNVGMHGLVSTDGRARADGQNYYISPQGNDRNDGSLKHPWMTIIRKQSLTKKLTVVLDEHARLRRPPKYVTELQQEFMGLVNASSVIPEACSTIAQFVESNWLPFVQEQRASSTVTTYKYYWRHLLKPYAGRTDAPRDRSSSPNHEKRHAAQTSQHPLRDL